MKKLIAILMATLLLVTLMAACGKKDTATGAGESDAVTEDTTPATDTTDATDPDVDINGDNTAEPNGGVDVDIDNSADTGDNEGNVISFDDLLDAAE